LTRWEQSSTNSGGNNQVKRLHPILRHPDYLPAAARLAPLARIAGDGGVAVDSLRPAIPSLLPRHFELAHHFFLEDVPRLRRPIRMGLTRPSRPSLVRRALSTDSADASDCIRVLSQRVARQAALELLGKLGQSRKFGTVQRGKVISEAPAHPRVDATPNPLVRAAGPLFPWARKPGN
jgi:hypothetical protein